MADQVSMMPWCVFAAGCLHTGALHHSTQLLCLAGSRTHFTAVSPPMQRHSHGLEGRHQSQTQQNSTSAPSPSAAATEPSFWHGRSPSQSSSSSSSSQPGAGDAQTSPAAGSCPAPCLFAFPLESNFSGVRYDPAVIGQIQTHGLTPLPQSWQAPSKPVLHRNAAKDHPAKSPRPYQSLQHEQQQVRPSNQDPAAAEAEEEQKEVEPGTRHQDREAVQSRSWHVLVDAAKACASSPPDLTKHPADFVVSTCTFVFCQHMTLHIAHATCPRGLALTHMPESSGPITVVAAAAGAVLLQDFWVPDRAWGPPGPQEGPAPADEEEEVLWRRHCGSVPCWRRLLQVGDRDQSKRFLRTMSQPMQSCTR